MRSDVRYLVCPSVCVCVCLSVYLYSRSIQATKRAHRVGAFSESERRQRSSEIDKSLAHLSRDACHDFHQTSR